jgi:hypothetical protein
MTQRKQGSRPGLSTKPREIFLPATDQIILEIIKPNLVDGPWIAGGACIQWLQGGSVSGCTDIDIFCKNERQHNNTLKRIVAYSGVLEVVNRVETQNAVSLIVRHLPTHMHYNIQVIRITMGRTPERIIEQFDIDACKIATDGYHIVASEQTLSDIENKIIRIKHIQHDSVRRIMKYLLKGFSLDPETYERLKSEPDAKWEFNFKSEEYGL